MNKGAIIEQGNHEELLAEGGFYAELYNSQFTGRQLAVGSGFHFVKSFVSIHKTFLIYYQGKQKEIFSCFSLLFINSGTGCYMLYLKNMVTITTEMSIKDF
ncbi:MAG TPA: hypothetical protein DEH07_10070 [Desulfotomaculum sp.]|nr:hypothetical protein [Desulfotomaculum sp.]